MTMQAEERELLAGYYRDAQSAEQICGDMGLTDREFRELKSRAKARDLAAGEAYRAAAHR